LAQELRSAGLNVEQQKSLKVYYRDIVVGEYAADLLVEGLVVVELKAVRAFDDIHLAQMPELPEGDRTEGWFTFEFWYAEGAD